MEEIFFDNCSVFYFIFMFWFHEMGLDLKQICKLEAEDLYNSTMVLVLADCGHRRNFRVFHFQLLFTRTVHVVIKFVLFFKLQFFFLLLPLNSFLFLLINGRPSLQCCFLLRIKHNSLRFFYYYWILISFSLSPIALCLLL